MITLVLGELSALPANLCPFSGRRELARFDKDFGEAVGEAVETTARSAVWQRPAKHLEVGWRLSADHWGQGLATEGAREVIRYGFEVLRFDDAPRT